jgi:hypothetical protein
MAVRLGMSFGFFSLGFDTEEYLDEAPRQISVAFISDKSDCRLLLLYTKSPSTTYSTALMVEDFRKFYLPLSYICTFSASPKLVYLGRE